MELPYTVSDSISGPEIGTGKQIQFICTKIYITVYILLVVLASHGRDIAVESIQSTAFQDNIDDATHTVRIILRRRVGNYFHFFNHRCGDVFNFTASAATCSATSFPIHKNGNIFITCNGNNTINIYIHRRNFS